MIFETIAVYHLQTDMCKIIYRPLYADKVMAYYDKIILRYKKVKEANMSRRQKAPKGICISKRKCLDTSSMRQSVKI